MMAQNSALVLYSNCESLFFNNQPPDNCPLYVANYVSVVTLVRYHTNPSFQIFRSNETYDSIISARYLLVAGSQYMLFLP